MDRPSRLLAGWTLTMALGALATVSGCRSMRNEVPPGKPYSTTGAPSGGLGFGSDAHPNTGVGGGLYQNSPIPGVPGQDPTGSSAGSAAPQLGTPTPSGGQYGVPAQGRFQAPGYTQGLSPSTPAGN